MIRFHVSEFSIELEFNIESDGGRTSSDFFISTKSEIRDIKKRATSVARITVSETPIPPRINTAIKKMIYIVFGILSDKYFLHTVP